MLTGAHSIWEMPCLLHDFFSSSGDMGKYVTQTHFFLVIKMSSCTRTLFWMSWSSERSLTYQGGGWCRHVHTRHWVGLHRWKTDTRTLTHSQECTWVGAMCSAVLVREGLNVGDSDGGEGLRSPGGVWERNETGLATPWSHKTEEKYVTTSNNQRNQQISIQPLFQGQFFHYFPNKRHAKVTLIKDLQYWGISTTDFLL